MTSALVNIFAMKDQLTKYIRYNIWANQRVCDFVKNNLSEEQLNKEIISSFQSVKKTLFHLWDAEVIWLQRLHGKSLSYFPSKDFKGSMEEGINSLLDNSKAFSDLIASKENSFFETSIKYRNTKGVEFETKASDVIMHIMNHSTFHRGQIITMFRQLGFTELFSTDYIAFCR